jgi:UDP-glucose 4-epimerase
MGKKVRFTPIFNPLLNLLSRKVGTVNRVFGNKAYDKSLSGDFGYCVVDFEESVRRSVV